MKLRGKVSTLIIPLILVPLLVSGWIAYEKLRETSREKSLDQVETLLDQLATQIRNVQTSAIANLHLFSNSGILESYILTADEATRYELQQPTLMRQLSRYQNAYPDYYEIRVILPDGYEDLRIVNRSLRNQTEDERETPFVQRAMESGKEIYSELGVHPDSQEVSLMVSKRLVLRDPAVDGLGVKPSLRGYLMISVSLQQIQSQVEHYRIGEGGYLMLASRSGDVWFHPDNVNLDWLSSSGSAFLQIPASLQHTLQNLTRAKNTVITEQGGSKGLIQGIQALDDVWLYSWMPQAQLLKQGRSLGGLVIVITLVTILLTIIFVFVGLDYLVIRPIHKLGQAARDIGHGNLFTVIPIQGDDEVGTLATSFREMSRNLQRSDEQIRYLAYHDNLTGLPNRLMLREYLGDALTNARRMGKKMAILFLDMDNFKRINDTLGHQKGDEILQILADELVTCIGQEGKPAHSNAYEAKDLVARLGGDEFLILLTDIDDAYAAGAVARKLLGCLEDPVQLEEHEFYLSVSIGITVFPDDANNPDDLIKYADIAMYHAKERGKNNYQYYSDAMNVDVLQRISLEAKLRKALQEDQFFLYFQPRVNAFTGEIIGAEALLRWREPEMGLIPPDLFIPIAEESGLIVAIGEWVLREACRQARHWQETGIASIPISVNVSSIQVARGDIQGLVRTVLQETKLDSRFLEVELTESTIMEGNDDVVELLQNIRRLGVSIALDDFGTGYSSLNYLRRFPIDTLKIDRSFVQEIGQESNGEAIISAIIAMAHALKLHVVAEGVETEGQYLFMQDQSCDAIQGYLLYRPMPAEDLDPILSEQRKQKLRADMS